RRKPQCPPWSTQSSNGGRMREDSHRRRPRPPCSGSRSSPASEVCPQASDPESHCFGNLGLVAGDPELHHGSILWGAFDGEPPTGNLRPLSHGREPQMTIG